MHHHHSESYNPELSLIPGSVDLGVPSEKSKRMFKHILPM